MGAPPFPTRETGAHASSTRAHGPRKLSAHRNETGPCGPCREHGGGGRQCQGTVRAAPDDAALRGCTQGRQAGLRPPRPLPTPHAPGWVTGIHSKSSAVHLLPAGAEGHGIHPSSTSPGSQGPRGRALCASSRVLMARSCWGAGLQRGVERGLVLCPLGGRGPGRAAGCRQSRRRGQPWPPRRADAGERPCAVTAGRGRRRGASEHPPPRPSTPTPPRTEAPLSYPKGQDCTPTAPGARRGRGHCPCSSCSRLEIVTEQQDSGSPEPTASPAPGRPLSPRPSSPRPTPSGRPKHSHEA